MEKKFLSRNEIEQKSERRREEVHVPEWGGWLIVQEMTGHERDAFEASTMRLRKERMRDGSTRTMGVDFDEAMLADTRARLAVATVVDESGNLLFTEKDMDWLTNRSAAALDRVFEVASRLSGMSMRDIEVLTQDLRKTPNGASDTVSH